MIPIPKDRCYDTQRYEARKVPYKIDKLTTQALRQVYPQLVFISCEQLESKER